MENANRSSPKNAEKKEESLTGVPLLTIGMIFKNEIRCLRRCLDSLRPLREAAPCELIMADTGSTDGCRAIAAEYADQLFDFPWTDDYAAARNAVLGRASGKWFFTVDCDEWLDRDIRELTDCLRNGTERLVLVVQRNYYTYDADGLYTDFLAARLFRRTDGVHYQDPFHEYAVFHTPLTDAPPALERTILHHDGYVELTAGGGQDKRREGLALLRRELEKNPDDLRTLNEFLSIGRKEPEYRTLLERAMRLAEARAPGWDIFGVSVFQNALAAAEALGLPELEAWSDRAEAMAPDSFCLRLDGNFFRASRAADREDWQEVIRREEAYLKALGEKRGDAHWKRERTGVNLLAEHPRYVQEGRIQLARALAHTGQAERALDILSDLRCDALEGRQAGLALLLVRDLSGAADAPALASALWENLSAPPEERAEARRAEFIRVGSTLFQQDAGRDGRRCGPCSSRWRGNASWGTEPPCCPRRTRRPCRTAWPGQRTRRPCPPPPSSTPWNTAGRIPCRAGRLRWRNWTPWRRN